MRIGKLRVAALLTATACATMMMLAACGEKPVEHTHTLQAVAAVAATCTTAGAEAYYKCTDPTCGKLFSDDKGETEITAAKVVPAKGHNMTKHEAVAATCTGEGTVEYYTCANEAADVYYADNQGAQKLESISTPKTAHQLVAVPEKKATCKDAGAEAYWNCITCQKKFSDDKGEHEIDAPSVIPQTEDHTPVFNMTQDNITKPVAEGGALEQVCSVCGKVLTSISYLEGFENVAEQASKTSELSKGSGTYYATTYSGSTSGGFEGEEHKTVYNCSVYVGFKVSAPGTYTLSFTDILSVEGAVRSLQNLSIGTTYSTIPSPSQWGIQAGATSPIPAGAAQLNRVSEITYDAWTSGGYEHLNSITFKVAQSDLDNNGGADKTLAIKVGVVYMKDHVRMSDRIIPLLITLTKAESTD